jgi:hypothetical protein
MVAYALCHNPRFFINLTDAGWNHDQPLQGWPLQPGKAGALALLLGPLQFPDRLCQLFYASQKWLPAWVGAEGIERRIHRRRCEGRKAKVSSSLEFRKTAIQITQRTVDRSGQIGTIRERPGIHLGANALGLLALPSESSHVGQQ